jgi:hypothetical protein
LKGRLLFFLFPVMLDDASGRRSHNGMMPGHMAHHTPDGGTLDATLGISHGGQSHDASGDDETSSEMAHGSFLVSYSQYTAATQNCAAKSKFS